MTTRKELVGALRLRYRSAAVSDRIKILDEFVALTCYHRKREPFARHGPARRGGLPCPRSAPWSVSTFWPARGPKAMR